MKMGMILYVTRGKEDIPVQDSLELARTSQALGVSAVCIATTEEEVAYGWWHLLTRGMHHVSCMAAAYDGAKGLFEPHGRPMRLCG
jgi:hypothetical protein